MIDIVTKKGEKYSFDPKTERLFKDGVLIPKATIEPVYCGNGKDSEPVFAGLFVKASNSIITKTGNKKPIVDINSIK